MKPEVSAVLAAQPREGDAPGLLSRALLAAVPVVSLGMLGAVPSYVIASRRGRRADWVAAIVFTAATVGWLFQAALTPVETHGVQFALDLVLLGFASVGASLHCLFARPQAGEPR